MPSATSTRYHERLCARPASHAVNCSRSARCLRCCRPPWRLRRGRLPRRPSPTRGAASFTRCSASCRTAHRPIRKDEDREEERDGYILERWDLDLNGIEPVPAFVARPRALERAAHRPSSSIIRTAAATSIGKQEFVDGPQLSPADAICEGADGSRLRRALHRPLGVRRAQPHDRGGYVQGDAVARAGALGNDGVRQPARARLSG